MWMLFALGSGLGAATLAIITKLFLTHINPLLATLIFAIITCVLLFGIGIMSQQTSYTDVSAFTKTDWLVLIIAGVINCLAFVSYLMALQYGKAAHVVAIDRLGIIFVVVFSFIFLQETITLKSILGALTMVVGAILLNT